VEELLYKIYASPLGPLTLVFSPTGVHRIEFGTVRKAEWKLVTDDGFGCEQQLGEYFAGQRREFSVALDLKGTTFQMKCWNALSQIPYGQTRTYAEIARAVDCPAGFRAVGMANHDNPIPIIIPCHRVIASDGGLGGYGGGLDIKRRLLRLEGAILSARAMAGVKT
jgi:O-6-methylguanine DNA methyltransferase